MKATGKVNLAITSILLLLLQNLSMQALIPHPPATKSTGSSLDLLDKDPRPTPRMDDPPFREIPSPPIPPGPLIRGGPPIWGENIPPGVVAAPPPLPPPGEKWDGFVAEGW